MYAEQATRFVFIPFEVEGQTANSKEVVETAPYLFKEKTGKVNAWAAWKVTLKDGTVMVLHIDDEPATTLKVIVLKGGRWF